MTRKHEWWLVPLPNQAWDVHQLNAYEQLQAQFPIPRSVWDKLLRKEGIRIHHHAVWLHLFPAEKSMFTEEYGELDILYEDDFVMIVNKPSSLLVHPENREGMRTLANLVSYYWMTTNQSCAIRHIHRLDRDTSGAILYAKNEIAHLLLDEAMRNRQMQRTYVAFVHGVVSANHGTIRTNIARDRYHPQKYRVATNGRHAITHYQVLARYRNSSIVQLQLETGRTHQIRVHMQHIGHPLMGDKLYGGLMQWIDRQALHAIALQFHHPITQTLLNISATWPTDLVHLQEKLKLDDT